jgi:glutamate-1-semialdehyde 2,1-aminomutase
VTQVGARVELQFCPTPPRNGQEAEQILQPELEQVMHLYLLNRGVLITPFHNMMLVSPATTMADVQQLLELVQDFVRQVLSPHQMPPAQ